MFYLPKAKIHMTADGIAGTRIWVCVQIFAYEFCFGFFPLSISVLLFRIFERVSFSSDLRSAGGETLCWLLEPRMGNLINRMNPTKRENCSQPFSNRFESFYSRTHVVNTLSMLP